jgi:hypothetical protein
MATSFERPTVAASTSDSYLSARVNNIRRSDRSRRPSSANVPRLDAVPEDRRPPPTTYRPVSGDIKGKGKAREQTQRSKSQDSVKRPRTEWVLDLQEVALGAGRWSQRERVILVVGSEFFRTRLLRSRNHY